MSAYTKGPWQVHSEHKPWEVIANIDGPDDGRYRYDSICDCDQDSSSRLDSDETKANARLIAAAPELLESAKELCALAYGSGRGGLVEFRPHEFDDLHAAIAKAEGK